ncbi:MAG: hypothetical protein J3R72DRAFT_521086 [Linnemannia gamsii]|nr:MAG: hypothetical protein J3R72DRAFT_521086 [Linnemannia gamsii]
MPRVDRGEITSHRYGRHSHAIIPAHGSQPAQLESLESLPSSIDWALLAVIFPRKCSRLQDLDLHFLEMDRDDIEQGNWVCKDLRILRFRIKGLGTGENIVRAISLWRAGYRRRWQEKVTGFPEPEAKEDRIDHSIEARVARHLLKFEKLCYSEVKVAPVSSHFHDSGQVLQLIPRCCSRLTYLDLHAHEMDMEDVEKEEGVCKTLATLRIKIKGVGTKDKTPKAIELWLKGRWKIREQRAGIPVGVEDKAG